MLLPAASAGLIFKYKDKMAPSIQLDSRRCTGKVGNLSGSLQGIACQIAFQKD